MAFRPKVSFKTILTQLGLTTGLKLCLDAGDISSVASSGQAKWLDTSGGGYDFYRGDATGGDAREPTFNGTPGNLSAGEYWGSDGNDSFLYDSANETWMDNLHKDNARLTILAWIYPLNPAGTANFIICGDNGAGAGGNVGMHFLVTSANLLTFRQANQPSGGNFQIQYSTATPLGQWDFVGVSLDEAVGANGGFLYQNGAAELFNSTYSNPAAGGATFTLQVGDRGNNQSGGMTSGSRFAFIAIWEGVALTQAQVAAVYNATLGTFTTVGTASGSGNATAVGTGVKPTAGSASGVGAATGVCSSLVSAVGTSSGSGTVTGVGATLRDTAGTASGSSTVSGAARSTWSGVGASVGLSTVSGAASSTWSGVGASVGLSTVSGVARSTWAASASAAGSSTVTSVGTAVTHMVGTAAGSGDAQAVATGITDLVGIASGASTAVGATVTFQSNTEIICVHWEDRGMSVCAESRAMIVPSEDRTMAVLEEERTALVDVKKDTTIVEMVVRYEERAMRVGPRKRAC